MCCQVGEDDDGPVVMAVMPLADSGGTTVDAPSSGPFVFVLSRLERRNGFFMVKWLSCCCVRRDLCVWRELSSSLSLSNHGKHRIRVRGGCGGAVVTETTNKSSNTSKNDDNKRAERIAASSVGLATKSKTFPSRDPHPKQVLCWKQERKKQRHRHPEL